MEIDLSGRSRAAATGSAVATGPQLSGGAQGWGSPGLLDALHGASPTGFAFLDRDLAFVYVNDAMARLHGVPREQHTGRPLREVLPGVADAIADGLAHVLATGQSVSEIPLSGPSPLPGAAAGEMAHWRLNLFPVSDGRTVVGVGVVARDVTETVRALELAQQARFEAETARAAAVQAQDRLTLLAHATRMLSETLDLAEAVDRLCRLCVPLLADWVVVTLVDDDGHVTTTTGRHRDGHEQLLVRYAAAQPRQLAPDTIKHRISRGAEPVLLPELSAADLRRTTGSAQLAELATELGTSSALMVPLVARRRVLGTLSLITGVSGRRLQDADLDMARDLGRRGALALDNARLYAAEHLTALTLQRSLLPTLPTIAGLATSAVYLAGGKNAEVGGDWYDVLALPDGATGLAIGDVMGHDLAATAAMGQLRSVLRSYAWEGDSPARVLDRLDRLVQGLAMADLATCIYARLEPAGGGQPAHLAYANAGHHPPLLRLPDGTVQPLTGGQSVLVGVEPQLAGSSGRPEAGTAMPAGSALLMFTDGLIEDRTQDLDVGLAAITQLLAAHEPAAGPDALTGALTEHVHRRAAIDDDICILAVTVT